MPGAKKSSEGLDARRRRILYRAWHRGTREMDLIMGPFADAHLADMTEMELNEFERLIEVLDPDLFAWTTGAETPPPDYDGPLWRRLKAFHTHSKPLHA